MAADPGDSVTGRTAQDRREPGRGEPDRGEGDRGEPDLLVIALDDLVDAAGKVSEAIEMLTSRAALMRASRSEGQRWRDIVSAEDRPLIAEMLTETIQQFEASGTRFRRAKARALHDEGMTMEHIAELFGLSRQRISALLRGTRTSAP